MHLDAFQFYTDKVVVDKSVVSSTLPCDFCPKNVLAPTTRTNLLQKTTIK